jgi:hypothetical protein
MMAIAEPLLMNRLSFDVSRREGASLRTGHTPLLRHKSITDFCCGLHQ